ncbi:MAG: FMN-binding protein [Candidatus Krumholzibacteria bacterium]|jgi:electron transport complex protein RnfG|nr:FMN-binding protein [Candidatus Krumholzibacteria bacterium]
MKTTLHMLVTLVAVGMFSGGSLSLVNDWADPLIQANQARARDEAIGFLVPGGDAEQVVDRDGLVAWRITANGEVKGWVLRHAGIGFQDKIDLMIALDPERRHVCGLRVLADSETPGLGTWIRLRAEHERALAGSADRDLGPDVDDSKNYPLQFFAWGGGRHLSAAGDLKVVKGRPRSDLGPGEVQAITAATISSQAVVDIVNAAVLKLDALLAAQGGTL